MTSSRSGDEDRRNRGKTRLCLVPRLLPNIHCVSFPSRNDRETEMAAEVTFKYPQPFTWAQVMDLDLSTISQGTHHHAERAGRRSPVNQRPFKKSLASSTRSTTSNPLKTNSSTSSTPPPGLLLTQTSSGRFKRTKTSCERQSYWAVGVTDSTNPSSDSQEERISILKHALVQKGVISPSHYDLGPSQRTQPVSADPEPNPPSTTGSGDGNGLDI
jgi:hypothetical protein